MADRRIRVPKDKADFLKDLVENEDDKGIFRLQVDALAFAAALGKNNKRRISLGETTKDPIRHDVFERQGHDILFNLLAISETGDPHVLADSDEMEEMRAAIFEEYANGGLEIMQEQLQGAVDYLDPVMLIISKQRKMLEGEEKEFNISDLLD